MKDIDYWTELLIDSFDEYGIEATEEQVKKVAEDIEIGHKQFSMAFSLSGAQSPYCSEIEKLKAELKREKEKVICYSCAGSGRIITQGPYHNSNSQCAVCSGEGKI